MFAYAIASNHEVGVCGGDGVKYTVNDVNEYNGFVAVSDAASCAGI